MAWRCNDPVMSYGPSVAVTNMKGPVEGISVEVMNRAGALKAHFDPLMY